MIDKEQWSMMGADLKGKIYEGLLEKNAEDTKSGAGQYFTPRALIQAMVECVQPKPWKTITDPACGTGGFFLAAYDYIVSNNRLDREEKEFLKNKTFYGNEILASTRRMCLMNMFLHNIGEIDGTFLSLPPMPLFLMKGCATTTCWQIHLLGRKAACSSPTKKGSRKSRT